MNKIIAKIYHSHWFEKVTLSLVIINTLCIILSSDTPLYQNWKHVIDQIQFFSLLVFVVEYCIRVSQIRRWHEFFNPFLVIDFIAIFPFFLGILAINTTVLRTLRLIKIFQILKVSRYSHALKNLIHAIASKKDEISIVLFSFAVAVVVAACIMYEIEGHVQANFSTIPKAMWWAVITFSSVGYGDVYPITALGKFVTSILVLLGIGLHSILISIIATGFIEQINARKREKLEIHVVEEPDNKN